MYEKKVSKTLRVFLLAKNVHKIDEKLLIRKRPFFKNEIKYLEHLLFFPIRIVLYHCLI
jgi:hypothetical protein